MNAAFISHLQLNLLPFKTQTNPSIRAFMLLVPVKFFHFFFIINDKVDINTTHVLAEIKPHSKGGGLHSIYDKHFPFMSLQANLSSIASHSATVYKNIKLQHN